MGLTPRSETQKWCKGWQQWASCYNQASKATDIGICPYSPSCARLPCSIITLRWQIAKHHIQHSRQSGVNSLQLNTMETEPQKLKPASLHLPFPPEPSWWILAEGAVTHHTMQKQHAASGCRKLALGIHRHNPIVHHWNGSDTEANWI